MGLFDIFDSLGREFDRILREEPHGALDFAHLDENTQRRIIEDIRNLAREGFDIPSIREVIRTKYGIDLHPDFIRRAEGLFHLAERDFRRFLKKLGIGAGVAGAGIAGGLGLGLLLGHGSGGSGVSASSPSPSSPVPPIPPITTPPSSPLPASSPSPSSPVPGGGGFLGLPLWVWIVIIIIIIAIIGYLLYRHHKKKKSHASSGSSGGSGGSK